MPYYTGDYYQGDNYYGDFLGIGKAIKRFQPLKFLGGAVSRIAGATPLGAVAATLIPAIGGRRDAPLIQPRGYPEPGLGGMVHRAIPGGSSGYGYYNKKGEFIEGKRPRLNPLNLHALRRAMRRAKGFEKQARRVGSFFSPGKTYRLKGRRSRSK